MITWDIENIIASTVEALLPTSSPLDKGLMMRFEFKITSHTEDGDVFYATRILELVFNRPSNHTKVFSRILDGRDNVLEDWKNTSNHVSCWRSDGLKDVFRCYMDVRKDMEEQNPSFDFRKDEVSISSPLFGGFITFVDVEIHKEYDDSYRYRLVKVIPQK